MAINWSSLPTEIQISILQYAIYADNAPSYALDNCPKDPKYNVRVFGIDQATRKLCQLITTEQFLILDLNLHQCVQPEWSTKYLTQHCSIECDSILESAIQSHWDELSKLKISVTCTKNCCQESSMARICLVANAHTEVAVSWILWYLAREMTQSQPADPYLSIECSKFTSQTRKRLFKFLNSMSQLVRGYGSVEVGGNLLASLKHPLGQPPKQLIGAISTGKRVVPDIYTVPEQYLLRFADLLDSGHSIDRLQMILGRAYTRFCQPPTRELFFDLEDGVVDYMWNLRFRFSVLLQRSLSEYMLRRDNTILVELDLLCKLPLQEGRRMCCLDLVFAEVDHIPVRYNAQALLNDSNALAILILFQETAQLRLALARTATIRHSIQDELMGYDGTESEVSGLAQYCWQRMSARAYLEASLWTTQYVEMLSVKAPEQTSRWLKQYWKLFDIIEKAIDDREVFKGPKLSPILFDPVLTQPTLMDYMEVLIQRFDARVNSMS